MLGESWLLTDENHFILDVMVPADVDIGATVEMLREMAGVVETGFFPIEATEVIVAADGGVRVLHRE
jgi:ribose 5-phosphate isomerase